MMGTLMRSPSSPTSCFSWFRGTGVLPTAACRVSCVGAVVDRSTTGRKSADCVDDRADGRARQPSADRPPDGCFDLAKVGVAGSNPVVRSRLDISNGPGLDTPRCQQPRWLRRWLYSQVQSDVVLGCSLQV